MDTLRPLLAAYLLFMLRRVAEAFERVFVLTGIFIKLRGVKLTVIKYDSRGRKPQAGCGGMPPRKF